MSKVFTPKELAKKLGIDQKSCRRKLRAMNIRVGKGHRHTFTPQKYNMLVKKLSPAPEVTKKTS